MWVVISVLLFLCALIFPLTAALASSLTGDESLLLDAYHQGSIVRLHIVAHSDSPRDQAIKLAVRDAILNSFGSMLEQKMQEGSDAAFEALKLNEEAMVNLAKKTARKLGFEGSVHAECGILSLPQKSHGKVVLPAGEYRAMRITLGSGHGQNWWCVLFPKLSLSLCANENHNPMPFWASGRIFQNWLINDQ